MPQYIAEQRRIRRSLTWLMALGFAALSGVVLSSAVLMAANQRQMGWIAHTFQVEREVDTIRLAVARIQGTRWRNAAMPTRETLATTREVSTDLTRAIDRFAVLSGDNPRNQARLPLMRMAARALVAAGEAPALVPAPADGGIDAVGRTADRTVLKPARLVENLTRLSGGTPAARVLIRAVAAIHAEEQQLLAMRMARLARTQNAFYAILGAAGVLLVAVGALLVTTLGTYTREINASRRALRDANAGLETAVQERTLDLQRANSELQRFAYIVSHDLRSPLVNVLGFTAELEAATETLRAALVPADDGGPPPPSAETVREIIADDLPEAIHFIRSSTQKMDRLINAILRLSREGQRTMNPEWVDLDALVAGIADSIRTQIDAADATVTIGPDMPTIHSDRLAVEQMIGNLVENAIKYGENGRPPQIDVSCARHGTRVRISVADNGRGIDPRDHDRIFDLFRRSGLQDRPGEGIGLAHVRALAYRLGGTVDVTSTPGAGSTFTITLPIYFSDNQDQVP